MEKQYPILIYGVFLPEGENHSIIENKLSSETPVILTGFDMFAGIGLPKVFEGTGSIKAHLVTFKENFYEKMLTKMDWVTSVSDENSANIRILHTFELNNETVEAWIYINNKNKSSEFATPDRLISDGDWARAYKERKQRLKTI
jgi:gamma-glutamylcyclotransferase (GGCT)/AIG2-like uncharacterized protein YtfP